MADPTTKLAILIIHGIGKPDPTFADEMAAELRERFADAVGGGVSNPKAEWLNLYDQDDVIAGPIAESLTRVWRGVNF